MFVPHAWPRASKTYRFFLHNRARTVFLWSIISPFQPYLSLWNEMALGELLNSFRMGASFQRNRACDEKIATLTLLLNIWEKKGLTIELNTNSQLFNHACLCNEESIKTKQGNPKSFTVGKHTHILEWWCTPAPQDRSSTEYPPGLT